MNNGNLFWSTCCEGEGAALSVLNWKLLYQKHSICPVHSLQFTTNDVETLHWSPFLPVVHSKRCRNTPLVPFSPCSSQQTMQKHSIAPLFSLQFTANDVETLHWSPFLPVVHSKRCRNTPLVPFSPCSSQQTMQKHSIGPLFSLQFTTNDVETLHWSPFLSAVHNKRCRNTPLVPFSLCSSQQTMQKHSIGPLFSLQFTTNDVETLHWSPFLPAVHNKRCRNTPLVPFSPCSSQQTMQKHSISPLFSLQFTTNDVETLHQSPFLPAVHSKRCRNTPLVPFSPCSSQQTMQKHSIGPLFSLQFTANDVETLHQSPFLPAVHNKRCRNTPLVPFSLCSSQQTMQKHSIGPLFSLQFTANDVETLHWTPFLSAVHSKRCRNTPLVPFSPCSSQQTMQKHSIGPLFSLQFTTNDVETLLQSPFLPAVHSKRCRNTPLVPFSPCSSQQTMQKHSIGPLFSLQFTANDVETLHRSPFLPAVHNKRCRNTPLDPFSPCSSQQTMQKHSIAPSPPHQFTKFDQQIVLLAGTETIDGSVARRDL